MAPAPVLCVRRGGLGDTLLCVPLLRELRRRWPGHPLHFAGVADHAVLLAAYGVVDRVLSSETLCLWALGTTGATGARARERLLGYQAVYGDAPELGALAGHPEVRVFDPLPRQQGVHAADWVLRQLGMASTHAERDALLREQWSAPEDAPIALHPGAGSPQKCWPRARWEELAARLATAGRRLLVLAGPAELERADPRNWRWPGGTAFHCDPDARVLARVLERADACVGNDSGPAHLAAALSMPTVVVFGPTDPRTWAPRGPRVRVLRGGEDDGWRWSDVDAVIDALAAVSS